MAFQYHNTNPNGYHIPDCVIRAITVATGLSYYDVLSKLKVNGDIYKCDELNVRCYEKLLDFDFNLPHYVGNGETAEEIANNLKKHIVILRMDGHLSVSVYGVIHDIWNCSNEVITDFWIVY